MSSPQNADFLGQKEWEMADWNSTLGRESGLSCRELILVYSYFRSPVIGKVRGSCVRMIMQIDPG